MPDPDGGESASSEAVIAANKLLVGLINLAIQGNPVATPSLVAGRLVGLERHAISRGLDSERIGKMTKAMIAARRRRIRRCRTWIRR